MLHSWLEPFLNKHTNVQAWREYEVAREELIYFLVVVRSELSLWGGFPWLDESGICLLLSSIL